MATNKKETPRNYDPTHPRCFEHPSGASLTIPNQTLSLRELLERYVVSGSVETFPAVYNDDDESIPDNIQSMDRLEKLDLARELNEGIRNARARMQAENDAKNNPPQPPPTPTNPPPIEQ